MGELQESFRAYYRRFQGITARGKIRFEQRDWRGVLRDAETRISLYHHHLNVIQAAIEGLLGDLVFQPALWEEIRPRYCAAFVGEYHLDLALIFFYSVMRRALVQKNIPVEYSGDEIRHHTGPHPKTDTGNLVRAYPANHGIHAGLIRRIVEDFGFEARYADLAGDAELAAELLARELASQTDLPPLDRVEVLKHPFFRNKAAYLIGRILAGERVIPLVIALLHPETGIEIDSLLTEEPDVANVFTSARSNFHTDPEGYREIFEFLKSIAPSRPTPYIYSSIGFLHPAKLELVRELRRHIAETGERFLVAPGVPGTVMAVFTLPTFRYVFKVIRDISFKSSYQGRRHVVAQYWRVHRMDRVGRMLDVTTFHNLCFRRQAFDPDLLADLLQAAPSTVQTSGDEVMLSYVYAARDVVPLDVYLADSALPESSKQSAVIDYGFAIKDLAAAGIFVGDYMPKNFGVTQFGRIMLYDYDDIDDLPNWNFRRMPAPPEWAETLPPEDWLSKGEHDVFPEHDFRLFLVPEGYRAVFEAHHADLLRPEYWNGIKSQLLQGWVPDFFPYPNRRRLHRA